MPASSRWVGALLISSPLVAFLGLPGPLAGLSDYLAFISLTAIGLQVARAQAPRGTAAPEARHAVPTAT